MDQKHSFALDMYIIKPMNLFREPKDSIWSRGKKMKQERYDSNLNKKWLTAKQLMKMIKQIKI